MNATEQEWVWVVGRIEGLGDMLFEGGDKSDHEVMYIRRRVGITIQEEGGPGQYALHVDRTPQLDLMSIIAPVIVVNLDRIVFTGRATPAAIKLAEQALGEGERIVKAAPRDVERTATAFAAALKGGNGS